MIKLSVSLFVLCLACAMSTLASEKTGPVVLTVTGAIENPSRGGFDDFKDAFFASLDVSFDSAAEFDLNGLEALGMTKFTVNYEDWPMELTVEGPLLADVLSAAGATGKTVVARALDGYAPEIPVSDLNSYPVILALKVNGRYLGFGGRGPAWIIYPRNDYPNLADTDDSKYVWSVFHIHVME